MRRIYRSGRRRASTTREDGPINPQSLAMVRGESHRATYRMHHFHSSPIYETGSRAHALFSSHLFSPVICR